MAWWHAFDPQTRGKDIPEDLVTASGSGVDPEISPQAAYFQVERIARVRKISQQSVRKIIDKYTQAKPRISGRGTRQCVKGQSGAGWLYDQ